MSKTLPANCQAGVVSVNGLPVPSVTVLSNGVGPSTGILVLDEAAAYYLANTISDLSNTIQGAIDGLTKAADALTQLDSAAFLIGASGAVPSPPIATANIAGITAAVAQLNTLKGMLK